MVSAVEIKIENFISNFMGLILFLTIHKLFCKLFFFGFFFVVMPVVPCVHLRVKLNLRSQEGANPKSRGVGGHDHLAKRLGFKFDTIMRKKALSFFFFFKAGVFGVKTNPLVPVVSESKPNG